LVVLDCAVATPMLKHSANNPVVSFNLFILNDLFVCDKNNNKIINSEIFLCYEIVKHLGKIHNS
jgi:hypothetical protein